MKTLVEQIIIVSNDSSYDLKTKEVIIKELLKVHLSSEFGWRKGKSHPDGDGEYFPEGSSIIMYSQDDDKMWIDFWYSSCPKNLPHKVSHWCLIPKKPNK